MNLKLYTRPYSGSSVRTNQSRTFHSQTALTSRMQTTELFPLESARHPTQSLFDIENHLKAYEDSQKLPDDSLFSIQVKFPERPKTSTLSGLTLKENQKTLNHTRSLNKITQNKSTQLFTAEQIISLPSEQDFYKILTKLEMVSSNRTAGTRRIVVNEGENVEIMLEAGVIQYFIVNCKGKKPPLVGYVKAIKGKVVTYASKLHAEPSKDICEVASKVEYFQIKDVSAKFRNDVIYVGVEAIVDSTINISVTFGQPLVMKTRKNLRVSQEEREIIQRPEREIVHRKKKKTIIGTDFVKLNIEKSKKTLKKNILSGNWQVKRESALQRKKNLMLAKQQHILRQLSRTHRSSQSFFKPPLELQRFWLSLLIFHKSLSLFHSLRSK